MAGLGLILCAWGIDAEHHTVPLLGSGTPEMSNNLYSFFIIVASGATILRHYSLSEKHDFIVFFIVGILFLRFFFGMDFQNRQFIYFFSWLVLMYYIIFVVKNFHKKPIAMKAIYLVLAAIVAAFVIYFPMHWLLEQYMFLAFIACWYMLTIVIRYFWLLEMKRRKRCKVCGGWGYIGNKGKVRFWWAVGFRTAANKTTCTTCKGKGWVLRYDELIHGNDHVAP